MEATLTKTDLAGLDQCHRCGGLMVQEFDSAIGTDERRCISCGERVDPVILQHRRLREGRHDAQKLFAGTSVKHLN